eukprot:scaffold576_cov260-Pinguiococcus_pyrenoidosus.AAC.68
MNPSLKLSGCVILFHAHHWTYQLLGLNVAARADMLPANQGPRTLLLQLKSRQQRVPRLCSLCGGGRAEHSRAEQHGGAASREKDVPRPVPGGCHGPIEAPEGQVRFRDTMRGLAAIAKGHGSSSSSSSSRLIAGVSRETLESVLTSSLSDLSSIASDPADLDFLRGSESSTETENRPRLSEVSGRAPPKLSQIPSGSKHKRAKSMELPTFVDCKHTKKSQPTHKVRRSSSRLSVRFSDEVSMLEIPARDPNPEVKEMLWHKAELYVKNLREAEEEEIRHMIRRRHSLPDNLLDQVSHLSEFGLDDSGPSEDEEDDMIDCDVVQPEMDNLFAAS